MLVRKRIHCYINFINEFNQVNIEGKILGISYDNLLLLNDDTTIYINNITLNGLLSTIQKETKSTNDNYETIINKQNEKIEKYDNDIKSKDNTIRIMIIILIIIASFYILYIGGFLLYLKIKSRKSKAMESIDTSNKLLI